MKFRVTSVASEETAPILRSVSVWLEDLLNAKLGAFSLDTGIDQFVIVFVGVHSDCVENSRFAKKHEDFGKYKDVRTGETVRFVSIAVQLDPSRVTELDTIEAKIVLMNAVIDRLGQGLPRSPKGFNAPEFLECFLPELIRLEKLIS